jgi:stage V sporulation protein D (sporulation-specific penicillin-binding protein)
MATKMEQKKLREEKRYRRRRNIKLNLIYFFAIAPILLYLIGRVAYIKVIHGDEYEREAILQQHARAQLQDRTIPPNRGAILSRDNQVLAQNLTIFNVFIDVRMLVQRSEETIQRTLFGLHEILGIPPEELEDYISYDPITDRLKYDTHHKIISREISVQAVEQIRERRLRDVYLLQDTKREYPYNHLAAQTIGFVRGGASWGIERLYEDSLRGSEGRMYRVFTGEVNPVIEEIRPLSGHTLITTLDLQIQQIAEEMVLQAASEFNPQNVVIAVMNPNTGELLANAQYPSFNLNEPFNIDYITSPRIREELRDASVNEMLDAFNPIWTNYLVSYTFEPGSIFKPIPVAAAVEEGVINEYNIYFCAGGHTVSGTWLPCWRRQGHGRQTLVEVLANSCNVAMMDIAHQMQRHMFFDYRTDFGFAQRTGIDLPSEESVSSPAVMYTLAALNPVELATSSYGQGFNNTVIQAMSSFAAIINGGNLMRPYVVSRILDGQGNIVTENRPTLVRKVISKETSDFMRTAMQATLEVGGTGRSAHIQGFNIGGKTGTGQQGIREEEQYVIGFISYIPVENPQYMVIVIIDKPEYYTLGITSAGPTTRAMLQRIIDVKNIQPADSVLATANHPMQMPSYVDRNVKEVVSELINRGFNFELIGHGNIVESTLPIEGMSITSDAKLFLYITDDETVDLTVIPDVKGYTLAEALLLLEAAGFVGVVDTNLYNDDDGVVVSMLPDSGTMVEKGMRVKVGVGE